MGSMMEMVAERIPTLLGLVSAIAFVFAAYFVITIDRGRATSPHKDDTQVGIKLVLFGFLLAGLQIAVGGADQLLSYVFGGFKGGSLPVRAAMPSILVGGVVIAVVAKLLLPRTNAETFRQAERYMLGVVALQYGVIAILGISGIVTGVFMEAKWAYLSGSVATTLVSGAVGFLALSRFGAASGWVQPAPPPAPPPYGGPPQGGYGAPPPGGGYGGPPPQGGYGGPPPQGGGFPPQGGGGFPPQGGGAPPQGGGYGPPGGGGFPPQGGGGGYPPR